jgi:serine protease Do
MSRGFLGVVPATFGKREGAVLNEVRLDGAAKKAGLMVGDVVTKMNDTTIKTDRDMRSFLTKLDPKVTIIAKVLREGEEIEKAITLGAYPSNSNHAADRMDKSGRRDGFSTVILHDATLKPEKCGGPVFDLAGNFIGMNIARNSRVRSYALPITVIKQFVDDQN